MLFGSEWMHLGLLWRSANDAWERIERNLLVIIFPSREERLSPPMAYRHWLAP
jgi:hypothetical protein